MNLFRFRTLQSRIFAFFFALLFVTQLGSILVTSTLGYAIVGKMLGEELQTGKRVFMRLFEQNTAFLMQGARILASDYGFREAIASNDADTIGSALDNHGDRIDADLMLFIGLDRQVYRSTATGTLDIVPGRLARLHTEAPGTRTVALVERIDGRLYQLIAVPVTAPLPIGTVIAGFRIDGALAHDIGNITHTEVSFINGNRDAPERVHASTLDGAARSDIDRALDARRIGANTISEVALNGSTYLSLRATLPAPQAQQSGVVLQKSLDQSLAPFIDLRDKLVLLGVVGLLLSGLSSLAIARGITRPIKTLAGFARKIAQGEYSEKPVVACTNEIGELAQAFGHMSGEIASRESHILQLAYSDTLTGLPNRAMFHDRLQQAIAMTGRVGKPLTVMLMDLDHFKYVNDSLGHHIGDLLLKEVALRLRSNLRDSDTVARLGGDEFAILLPTADIQNARKVVRTLLGALEQPMTIEGQIIDVRGSFGMASAPLHGTEVAGLLRCADVAMYQAKRNSSGFAEYDARYDHNTLERLSLMSELREAVENDHLVLYYQPKVDLKSSSSYSVEALVRWIHPRRGFVPPNDFIPFAEQTGYIKAITNWVLNQGIRQCADWKRAGLDVNISINISARDLMNADLPVYFASLLREHGCPPERICLEITESAILDDPTHAMDNLKRLEAIGCKLSIDDYGTGYSSLAYLKRLPVGELKIDRSFVQNMVNDPNDTVIVRSTIDLAHNLGLRVVAEGVENAAILSQLCLLGCDQAQGYFFSKPVSAADFQAWVQSSAWRDQVQVACSA
ncbi:MAG: EAL domain-containing protein [Pseudomonadota bacterium]